MLIRIPNCKMQKIVELSVDRKKKRSLMKIRRDQQFASGAKEPGILSGAQAGPARKSKENLFPDQISRQKQENSVSKKTYQTKGEELA